MPVIGVPCAIAVLGAAFEADAYAAFVRTDGTAGSAVVAGSSGVATGFVTKTVLHIGVAKPVLVAVGVVVACAAPFGRRVIATSRVGVAEFVTGAFV